LLDTSDKDGGRAKPNAMIILGLCSVKRPKEDYLSSKKVFEKITAQPKI